MSKNTAIAIVGAGAILPDAFDAPTFWKNIQAGRSSIADVPADRWREDLYYNPDPLALDKTYSKIGAWVRGYTFEPFKTGLIIPPKLLESMDQSQQWAIAASQQALADYGYPRRPLNPERVAVILGNAMGGELHYRSSLRINMPEYLDTLSSNPDFKNLPAAIQKSLLDGVRSGIYAKIPVITEDTMPGEISNIIAGRVANVFNFSGPNFVTDAACASSFAALQSAVEGLQNFQFDAALTGGVDRNMGAESFVKFSKIGALSPDGSRPYADGANGFVMGEGAAVFLVKRLEDAERDGDKIYAVVRGIGGSSDGKGKGITAPNPIGQQRALERAWKNAGLSPATAGLIEGHGTSTRVGDVAELGSLDAILGQFNLPVGKIALGSVKSNIGHLKSAAGAAGLLKTIYALSERVLPPSINFQRPNPNIDFTRLPLAVNTALRPWEVKDGEVRRAGISSFGFGGTNFHVVVEEYRPGVLTTEQNIHPGVELKKAEQTLPVETSALEVPALAMPVPYHGLYFLGADSPDALKRGLAEELDQIRSGFAPANICPTPVELGKTERLAIDYESEAELVKRLEKALKALESEAPASWQALTAQGIYRGSGKPGKVAFLFPGQGSQYINMLRDLRDIEPLVDETIREADEVMNPILGRPLSSYIFIDGDEAACAVAEKELRNTAITQPAMLTANVGILRVMAKFGFKPDMVIGHSLGEYAALVAAGVLTFAEALEVVAARGREMTKVSMDDNGCMAAVSAPLPEVERILQTVDGYVVIANINSPLQCVIGGATKAVDAAIAAFSAAGFTANKIPVSHAFHTKIVAPASQPLRQVIARMNIQAPRLPIVANVTGQLYPTTREEILDILAAQVASPVQFIQGVTTLYNQGARIFVESGPKRVISSLVSDVLKGRGDIAILSTNHPRKGGRVSMNEALCGLYAAGVIANPEPVKPANQPAASLPLEVQPARVEVIPAPAAPGVPVDGLLPLTGSVVISGAGLGLPGRKGHVFDDNNVQALLHGEMRIEPIPMDTRQTILAKRVTRLVKSEAGAVMQSIDDIEQTLKLAGQRGEFDIVNEFGMPQDRSEAIDISTQLAIAAGIEALRDAGIPLVMSYKQTSKGTYLPDRWKLPEALADETGVIFGSAFPGLDRMAEEADGYYQYQMLVKQLEELRQMQAFVPAGQPELQAVFARRTAELEAQVKEKDYHFHRHFIFRILAMGHSQFAEYIGARGPNTHVNAACATTTHAVAVAEDWIRTGRARRVVVIAGDDVTSGQLPKWIGTGLMAGGAATTEGNLRMAALPFDRRRNGLIMGMGAAALVVEAEDAVRERGMRAIAEVLATHIANSAYHGTRLNVNHVSEVMNRLLTTAEQRFGIRRSDIAPETVFVSHETYTPARGGSAAAEIFALRQSFGDTANRVVIANTKGYTGHTMGVGVEDVLAVKALQFGIVPPIANIQEGFEPDPDLGDLNLSRGGQYPVQFALRLGAGFGSQIAMTLLRRIPGEGERIEQGTYKRWLAEVSGYPETDLEVVQRTLRIHSQGAPLKPPARSKWQYGHGPTMWANSPGQTINAPVPAVQTALVVEPVQIPAIAQPVMAATAVSIQPAVQAVGSEDIKTYVLSAVSEKTGYPVEMLDVDLDLEADLGVDTVKQAELFATIRNHYGIPRREDLRLSEFNTLEKVIIFMQDALKSAAHVTAVPVSAVVPVVVSVPAIVSLPAYAVAPVIASVPAHVLVSSEEIKAYVLSAVAEKTGYPVEMLDLDLDLEADLGVDTVKQAELFATIRGHYGIPRREDLRLSEFNTLAKVVGFMEDALKTAAAPTAQTTTQSTPAPVLAAQPVLEPAPAHVGSEEIKAYVLSAVSEKTGYPVEMLDVDLDLEADLGVDTVKQAELFATIRNHYGIPRREDLRLSEFNTLEKVIGFMQEATGASVQHAGLPAVVSTPVPAAVPAAQPIPASVPIAAVDADTEGVKAYVLAAVSEKTGYPVEMLDIDLDLEADLGVDTVKQAELFATIRNHYGIPRREDLRLSDYNTLGKVVTFMQDALKPAEVPAPTLQGVPFVPEVVVAAPADAAVAQAEAALEEKPGAGIRRRVPVPTLRPSLDMCVASGVKLEPGVKVLIIADQHKTAEALARKLRGRKVQVTVLNAAGLSQAEVSAKIGKLQADGPFEGLYFLPALDVEAPLAEMNYEDWQSGLEQRVHLLFSVLRALPENIFLVSATRLGGLHGYAATGTTGPLGGAVSGFTKTIAMERPEAFVKVVDFAADVPAAVLASRLVEETLNDPGVVEVGWEGDLRFGIGALEREVGSEKAFTLDASTVYVVSGGSGAITGRIITDLATANGGGTFYLLDRAPLPERDDPDLPRVKNERESLRQDLVKRMSAGGQKITPVMIENRLVTLERAAAAIDMMNAIEKTGAKAIYKMVDITDFAAVSQVAQQIAAETGQVDVFIHAAGLERSRKLENKPEDEFRLVFGVKALGFFTIFKSLETAGRLPRSLVFFSSVAGRFGNAGQTDYSAANDLLCKLASGLPRQYPGLRAVAVDWSAWAEVGMATRGNIPEAMERAGIDLIRPAEAAPMIGIELQFAPNGNEAIIAGALGALLAARREDGGLDVALANQALRSGRPLHTMLTSVVGLDLNDGLIMEAELNPENEPFLRDHSMNGVPVLPGVMGIEGFSAASRHIASVLASTGKGSFEVTRMEDIRFMAPFKFYRNQPRRITWKAIVLREASGLVANAMLESTATGKLRGGEKSIHFSGRVFLEPVDENRKEVTGKAPKWNGSYTINAEEIYKLYFHGPAFQVLDGVQRSGEMILGRLNKNLPPTTSGEHPLEALPLLVELCLQTAGIWEVGLTGVLALPKSICSLSIYRKNVNGVPIYAEVRPYTNEANEMHFDARVVDAKGRVYLELKEYRTSPMPYGVENDLLTPLRKLVK